MIEKAGVRAIAKGKQYSGTALVDTEATTTIIGTSLAEGLQLSPLAKER
jgi:hypothetical protein